MHKNEEIRLASSSGGVFTALAEQVIAAGGVVFGARFNEEWEVVHDCTESVDGLAAFRGSKYVQSAIGDSFKRCEEYLKQDRRVLFTGTPCQIAGLKNFLRKEYAKLLTVEVACHGVPSPLVWREYLKGKNPKTVNFRDKTTGWKNYSVVIGQNRTYHDRDAYMNCFIANYSLRQSCFNCRSKGGRSGADLLVADLWGISQIAPEIDDDKGISAVIVWKQVGEDIINDIDVRLKAIDFEKVVKNNPAICKSTTIAPDYELFWNNFDRHKIDQFAKRNMPDFVTRVKIALYRYLKR